MKNSKENNYVRAARPCLTRHGTHPPPIIDLCCARRCGACALAQERLCHCPSRHVLCPSRCVRGVAVAERLWAHLLLQETTTASRTSPSAPQRLPSPSVVGHEPSHAQTVEHVQHVMNITCTRQLNAPSAGPFSLPPSTSTSLPPATAPVCRHSRVLRLCTDVSHLQRGACRPLTRLSSPAAPPHHSPLPCRPIKRIPMVRAPNVLERMWRMVEMCILGGITGWHEMGDAKARRRLG